jgi:hypothetical protein
MNRVIIDFGNLGINLNSFNFWLQIFLFAILVIYFVYVVLITKQVRLLNESIRTPGATLINLIALVQFILAGIILISVALLVLL